MWKVIRSGRGGYGGTNSKFYVELGLLLLVVLVDCARAMIGGLAEAFMDSCLAGTNGLTKIGDSVGGRLLLLNSGAGLAQVLVPWHIGARLPRDHALKPSYTLSLRT